MGRVLKGARARRKARFGRRWSGTRLMFIVDPRARNRAKSSAKRAFTGKKGRFACAKMRQAPARSGTSKHGLARSDTSKHGLARSGTAGQGQEWSGKVRQGLVWPGKAGHEQARATPLYHAQDGIKAKPLRPNEAKSW